ncbi:MAG: phosphoglycerate mutase family protein [bacterium]|nr:phosphoglycerate mutase family protein [bacterium]
MPPISEQKIVLARHGQTNFNLDSRIQDPWTPRLTEIGHTQALGLKKEIENLKLSFDIIICSDTTRNVETLKDIYSNYESLDNLKIDFRLRERYHKDLAGKTKNDVEKELGIKFDDRFSWHLYFEGTNKSQLTGNNYPNDESLESVRERLNSLIDSLKDAKTVLLLGSSIINQYILEYLKFGTIGDQKPRTPEEEEIDFQENNELRIITVDEKMRMKKYTSVHYG